MFPINSKKIKIKNSILLFCGKYRKLKNPKVSYIFEKILVLSIICSKCGSKDEKIFKEKESLEVLKILGLIIDIKKYQK